MTATEREALREVVQAIRIEQRFVVSPTIRRNLETFARDIEKVMASVYDHDPEPAAV